ncbi:MAG: YjgN family protein [Sphingomonadaceae bacterium]|nr:YjgN family protein [Sphingomonadaceae bacterium]
MDETSQAADPRDGFDFDGQWREYLPIAATNLLLMLVTLGFYRFWATARERRYLWSRTRLLGEPLEWAGSGKEMFIGFLVAMLFFVPIVLFLNFGMQALVLRGQALLAFIGWLVAMSALFYLLGVAKFRAVRYRLSRSYWRGIRGGSDDPGWDYGAQTLGRSGLALFTAGLLVPWTMATLWRLRWSAMSFGPYRFAVGDGPATKGLKRRWLLIYLAPFLLLIPAMLLGAVVGLTGEVPAADPSNPMGSMSMLTWIIIALTLAIYVLPIAYFAAFYRKMVGEMTLGDLRFDFTARTIDWIKLLLGHIGLVIVTLGFGLMYIGYRNWAFFARHLVIHGTLDPAALTQSRTALQNDAEGLADAFDIGAI